jgi:hypothetical protein
MRTHWQWQRVEKLLDATTMALSLGALLLFVFERASALSALGAVFALPIVAAVVDRIARLFRFGYRGTAPPERLGRSSWVAADRRPT